MSRKITFILVLISCLFSFCLGHASFEEGNKLYLEKKYDEAFKQYQSQLEKDPLNTSVLVNIGLTEFHRGQPLMAIGYFRKALAINPQNATAEAGLKYVSKQSKLPQIPQNLSTLDLINTYYLDNISIEALFIFSLIGFGFSGYLWIRYLGRRKQSYEKETALPPTPVIAVILSVFFVIFSLSFILKLWDAQFTRGSIIVEKISLQTAPGEDQVSIMDLYGGFEVKILQRKDDWLQIHYPGTPSGWVKKSTVMMTH